ncbi:hypothetical protein P5673_028479 [Acropora cervicornis]|uniref:Uncharacterized protein n=1 Tax=Acropora cervicornis TaxID=6130 RepID=A0AAD9PXB4_ACRCE|nr:hypothetical protein P5673_028479 [Acropora cervicornis]
MEEGFNLLLSKRRTSQLSSDSSLDTSPEPKKLKEGDISYSSGGERNEDGDDIILSALNMAEDLQKLLQDILKKLKKLDVIEEAGSAYAVGLWNPKKGFHSVMMAFVFLLDLFNLFRSVYNAFV